MCSDVNKTFLSRPRPRLFSQDQGKTLLGRPLNRL